MHGGPQVNINTIVAGALGLYAWNTGSLLVAAAAAGVWYFQPLTGTVGTSLLR